MSVSRPGLDWPDPTREMFGFHKCVVMALLAFLLRGEGGRRPSRWGQWFLFSPPPTPFHSTSRRVCVCQVKPRVYTEGGYGRGACCLSCFYMVLFLFSSLQLSVPRSLPSLSWTELSSLAHTVPNVATTITSSSVPFHPSPCCCCCCGFLSVKMCVSGGLLKRTRSHSDENLQQSSSSQKSNTFSHLSVMRGYLMYIFIYTFWW